MSKQFVRAALCGAVVMLSVNTEAVAQSDSSFDPRDDVRSRVQADLEDRLQFADSRVRRGFEISPVPLNLRGKNRAKVGMGSYLVNAVGGCNDCHTNPPFVAGGDPFRGEPKIVNAEHYLAGGTAFGPFVSRNITPDAGGKPAGLSLAQFVDVMRNGTDYKNLHPQISPLLQVMPWPVYREMTTRDLEAIYEYLSAIPHAERGAAKAN